MNKFAHILITSGLCVTIIACGARRREAAEATSVAATVQAASAVQPAEPQPLLNQAEANLPQNSHVLFQDDFQDGAPDGWKTSGAWYVNQDGDVYVFGSSGAGGAYVPTGGAWSGYTFQSDFRLDNGGLLLSSNLTKQGRYSLKADANGVYLLKEQPAKNWSLLAQAGPVSLGNWHKLELHVLSGRIQTWIDQVLWFDLQDNSPLTQGTIALTTLDASRAEIDNILVTRITGSLPSGTVQAPAALSNAPSAEQVIEEVQNSLSGQEVIVEDAPVVPEPQNGGQPDLVFNTVAFDPDPVVSNQPARFNFSIGNIGSAPAGAFAVLVQFDPATGLADCWVEFPSLAAGQDNYGGCDLNTQAAAGEYPIQAMVDPNHVVAESNEGNNTASRNMSVSASNNGEGNSNSGQPDLFIGSLTFTPANPKVAQEFEAMYVVVNRGNVDSGAFTSRLKFHAEAGIPDCNTDISSVRVGVPYMVRCSRTIHAAAGNYPIKVTVDVEGEITESDENNNTYSATLTIAEEPELAMPDPGVISPGGGGIVFQPDLDCIGFGVSTSASPIPVGKNLNVGISIKNIGQGTAGGFNIQWLPDKTKNVVGCSWDVDSILAGAILQFNCVYPGYAKKGTYNYLFLIDPDQEVSESNEGNNSCGETIVIGL